MLKSYGYKNYAAYLKSKLWEVIRGKVLKNDDMCVCGCGRPANQIHHKTYTEANLLGTTLRGLVAISRDCHYSIEFSDEQKVSLGEANRKLKQRRKEKADNPR